MAEETLIVRLNFDFDQPVKSINEVQKRVKTLTGTLKDIPKEGTPAFRELATTISRQLGVSIDQASQKIRNFQQKATKEIQQGNAAVKEFNKNLRTIQAPANSIKALEDRFKSLRKEVKILNKDTQEFADKSAELKKVRAQLSRIKNQAGVTGKSLTQLSSDFRKQFSGLSRGLRAAFGFGAIRTGISTLRSSFTSLVDEYKDSNAAIRQVDSDLSNLSNTIKQAAVEFIQANQEGISNFINFLKESIPLLKENASTILQLVAALALFIARQRIAAVTTSLVKGATLAYNVAVKLLTGQIRIATVAQKAFNTASKSVGGIVSIIVTAVAAGAAAYALFTRESANARQANINFSKEQSKITEAFNKETKELNNLFGILKDTNASTEDKRLAIERLNNQYGEYLPNVDLESASQQDLERAYRATSRAIAESIVERKKAEFVDQALTEQLDLLTKQQLAIDKANDATKNFNETNNTLAKQIFAGTTAFFGLNKQFNEAKAAQNQANAATKQYNSTLDSNQRTIDLYREKADLLAKTLSEGLNFVGLQGDASQLQSTFQLLTQEQTDLQESIKNAAVEGRDYSAELVRLRQVSSKLALAQKAVAEATKEPESRFDALQRQQNQLKNSILESILAGRDYANALARLNNVSTQLSDAQEKLKIATEENGSTFERLSNLQKSLENQIKESIANNEDYSGSEKELAEVTAELNRITKQYDDVVSGLNETVNELVKGSLADYSAQIEELQEKQKGLNLESDEYLNVQRQIDELEKQRNFSLQLLSTNTDEFRAKQVELNEELSDSKGREEALRVALDNLSKITDATDEGSAEIKAIEEKLASDLRALERQKLVDTKQRLNNELASVKEQEQQQLAAAGENATKKAQIEELFSQRQNEILIEAASVNAQIYQADLDEFKRLQQEKQKEAEDTGLTWKISTEQALSEIGGLASNTFQLISQAQQQAFDKQNELIKKNEEDEIKRAESIGASEQAIQKVREKFARQREILEKQQANQRKAIALTEAIIATALAVAKALPNIALASFAGATGALQIGIIASKKFALGDVFDIDVRSGKKYARGAYLKDGLYHSQGGMPIINPVTGRKVAEIEKGEGIINKRSMASKDVITVTGTPYQIASQLNSYKGFGVAFPKAKNRFSKGGSFKIAKRTSNRKYALGGAYGINKRIVQYQRGAVFAADLQREAQSVSGNLQSTTILESISQKLSELIDTNSEGFGNQITVTEQIDQINQRRQDEANAS